MRRVKDIENALYAWAPKELAADWDNVGHLVGDSEAEVKKVLVALDITEEVVNEAVEMGADLIVAHHPVMNCRWHAVQSVREDNPQGRILMKLIQKGISAICMHTNLDAAEGGVNDILAQKLGLSDIELLGEDKIGRIGTLKCEIPLAEFLPFVVKSLSCNGLRYRDGGKTVLRVAVGGGACDDYIGAALEKGCDTFVTSDLSYHTFLDTHGLNLIDAGHFPTEDVICPVVCGYLKKTFPEIETVKSTLHKEVIQYYM